MKIKDYREKNRRIHIPISEYDVDTFHNLIIKRTDHIDWTFETDDGEPINLRFESKDLKIICDNCKEGEHRNEL